MLKQKNILDYEDKIKSALVSAAGQLMITSKSPDETLGDLFGDIQRRRLFTDSKSFADLIPRRAVRLIRREYSLTKDSPKFEMSDFISHNFYSLSSKESLYATNPNNTPRQHILELWGELERKQRRNKGSLVALPYAYVVPGGRFSEQYYWDSYFIMLGLAADNRWDLLEGMVKNMAYMIRRFGFIPTANRTYLLSRSQPPFFSYAVSLLARRKGKLAFVEYLPYLVLEHRFWTKGHRKLRKSQNQSLLRNVKMPDGSILNRYYDTKTTPRTESLPEDQQIASNNASSSDDTYLNIRAAAESGWDFSSRWLDNPDDLATIRTTDIVPVDLNCLLYQLELTIYDAYRLIKQPLLAKKYQKFADSRKNAIQNYCWDESSDFYYDFDFTKGCVTSRPTIASIFPMYVGIADKKQGELIASRIEKQFLKKGGLVTTLVETGQQWDSPNGWAPMQWVAIKGLIRYGHVQLADEIKHRWVRANLNILKNKGKLVEKYNVIDLEKQASGGEYPLQDGFGWTNGVLAALMKDKGEPGL